MAKIIIQGTKHIEVPVLYDCACGSRIEYTKADLHSDQRGGDYVVCPVCTAYISSRLVFGNARRA